MEWLDLGFFDVAIVFISAIIISVVMTLRRSNAFEYFKLKALFTNAYNMDDMQVLKTDDIIKLNNIKQMQSIIGSMLDIISIKKMVIDTDQPDSITAYAVTVDVCSGIQLRQTVTDIINGLNKKPNSTMLINPNVDTIIQALQLSKMKVGAIDKNEDLFILYGDYGIVVERESSDVYFLAFGDIQNNHGFCVHSSVYTNPNKLLEHLLNKVDDKNEH